MHIRDSLQPSYCERDEGKGPPFIVIHGDLKCKKSSHNLKKIAVLKSHGFLNKSSFNRSGSIGADALRVSSLPSVYSALLSWLW